MAKPIKLDPLKGLASKVATPSQVVTKGTLTYGLWLAWKAFVRETPLLICQQARYIRNRSGLQRVWIVHAVRAYEFGSEISEKSQSYRVVLDFPVAVNDDT